MMRQLLIRCTLLLVNVSLAHCAALSLNADRGDRKVSNEGREAGRSPSAEQESGGERELELVGLQYRLPPPWKRLPASGDPGVRLFAGWRAPGGKELHIAYWPEAPEDDGGGMMIAEEWDVTVAGQKVRAYRARAFQGFMREVLVVYLKRGDGYFRIHTRNVPGEEFEAILSAMSF